MPPALSYLLPLGRETRWTDLLAVLIQSDPASAAVALQLGVPEARLSVRREARAGDHDRLDLQVLKGERVAAVVEVKVLSGLGRTQLDR